MSLSNRPKIIKKVSIAEALELGRLEGIRDTLRELDKEISSINNILFLRAYIKARLKSINDIVQVKDSLKL